MMQPGDNMMMQGPAQAGPIPAQATPSAPQPATPRMIADFRVHNGAILHGLMGLMQTAPGGLTKKSVFDAAADMIAKGAFPTPEAKQDLIVTLSSMPDKDPELRKVISELLFKVSSIRAQLHAVHGPGEPPMMEAAPNV